MPSSPSSLLSIGIAPVDNSYETKDGNWKKKEEEEDDGKKRLIEEDEPGCGGWCRITRV